MPSKNSRSFLEKFEGKKNAISREGLLHLLDMKKQSFGTARPTQMTSRNRGRSRR
jgi:hypothetical protein